MSIFETDYLKKTCELVKEAFKFKKYKAMHPFFAVTTGVVMIPLVFSRVVTLAFLAMLSFGSKTLETPLDFMHGLLKSEGEEVKHATQCVIYIISWPILFLLYAFASLLLVEITVLYAALSIYSYIWSLGGFKFHLFVTDAEDISIEVKGKYNRLPVVFFAVSVVLLVVLPIVHGVIYYASLYADYLEHYFNLSYYSFYRNLSVVFSLLYSLIGFAPRPTVKNDGEAIEKEDDIITEPTEEQEELDEAPEEEILRF